MSEVPGIRAQRDSLQRSWSAFMSGDDAVGPVREEVISSWRRTRRFVSPTVSSAPAALPEVDPAPLLKSVHILEREFRATMMDSGLVIALADERGKVVWTTGEPQQLKLAEQANFAPGARWDEVSMGINAISLALTSDGASTVWAAEHWSPSLHTWSCYAALIRDPSSGRPLGVLNFSTYWDRRHPLASIAVVTLAERMAPEIVGHRPVGPPASMGGLRMRVLGQHSATLDGVPVPLTRRQTEIVLLLALRPGGVSLEELHADLYGDAAVALGTLRAEISHLRRLLKGRISRSPYRLEGRVGVDAIEILADLHACRMRDAAAKYTGQVLPWSESPRIVRLGRTVEVALRDSMLASSDYESAIALTAQLEDDIELFEHVLRILPPDDARRHVMRGHLLGIG